VNFTKESDFAKQPQFVMFLVFSVKHLQQHLILFKGKNQGPIGILSAKIILKLVNLRVL
jgi:hypothetical protein